MLPFVPIPIPVSAPAAQAVPAEVRVTLTPAQLLCEEAVADPSSLVDEAQISGDPASGRGGAPKNAFFPGWSSPWRYPVHVTIDLGTERALTRLFFYIGNGGGTLEFATGKPFAWNPSVSVPRDGYQSWREVKLDAKTRYIRITLPAPTEIPEIVVYARPTGETPIPTSPKTTVVKRRPGVTFDQFVGTNAFIDDPLERIVPVAGFVREYHSWAWDTENPDRKTRFQPSGAAGGNAWFFDTFYKNLAAAGVTVVPCVQGNAAGKPFQAKPDFAEHASHLFQYAARYGRSKVPDAQLSLAPGQPRVSGQSVLGFLENWNEPDKTWEGRDGWFTPFELARMCAADEDAVRHADPKMTLVLGGLAGLRLDYLDAMKHWADFHRGGKFPAGVINLHHYCTDGGEQGFGKTGISPESDNLRGKMEAAANWRDRNAPHCELWLTEFGWDTDARSPIHSPALGKLDAQAVQAAWLLRAYFLLAAARVDRAAMFLLRDVKSDGGGVFETCGLVTEKGAWTPKTSWYFVATLKQRLKGFRFAADIPTGRPDVMAMRFTDGKRDAIALWCPTSEDKTVADFALPEIQKARSATVVTFAAGSTTGKSEPLEQRKQRRVTVSETPILVFLEK